MEWLEENWFNIAGIIGMAYALALAIVKLTPTPRDDEALERVSPILKGLARLFGLDLSQGINTTPNDTMNPSKTKLPIIAFVMGSVVLFSGCNALSPGMSSGQQYIIASQTYATTANVLADLVLAGKLTTADKKLVKQLSDKADMLLDEMASDVLAGKEMDAAYTLRKVNAALDDLLMIQLQIQAEEKASADKQAVEAGKGTSYGNSRNHPRHQGADGSDGRFCRHPERSPGDRTRADGSGTHGRYAGAQGRQGPAGRSHWHVTQPGIIWKERTELAA